MRPQPSPLPLAVAVASCLVAFSAPVLLAAPPAGVLKEEFIYETAPTPQCHASTLAESEAGLVAAWFGGKHEKNPDVGIWVARHVDGKWTTPVEVANGVQSATLRHPTWNPVLFQIPNGPLQLYYKVGPSPRDWWGMLIESTDAGTTWGKPRRLPEGILGPIKNVPVLLADGTLLSPTSTEHDGWQVHLEWSKDAGKTWERTRPINQGDDVGAIQPTIFQHPKGRLQILCRNQQPKSILEAWSEDQGRSWSDLSPLDLPNPNSGIAGATLKNGRHALVYNHTQRGRSPLNLAISDDGKVWQAAAVLESEPGEYSYPTVIQSADGLAHVVYTWKRTRVKHVVFDPARLKLRPIENGKWPK